MDDGKTTKSLKKETAQFPPRRGQVLVRVMEELPETVFSMIRMLTGKTDEGEGGDTSTIYYAGGKSGGTLPVRKIKA